MSFVGRQAHHERVILYQVIFGLNNLKQSYVIETKNLTKKFGAFTALSDLNLRIESGVIHGLLGPNGAGKTTAIKILCGLLRASSGDAYIFGKKVPDRSILPQIGYMPQETALYLDLSVYHNLALYGELYGMSRSKIAEREKELLKFIALEKWRNEPVSNLSGGMKHRVSLACSMIHEPKLLFLDEPTVGVDPELRASFWQYFNALKQKDITIVLTTHYMDEAQHCDKIGLLRLGKLIAEGTPGEITRQTNTTSLEEAFLALSRQEVKA
jgi:ABC-2 type transport system ATP-binding protein